MRVLHVVPTYVPAWRHGGPVRAVHGLASALAARGHEVAVFTTDVNGSGRLAVPLATPTLLDDVSVSYFPVRPPRRLYRAPELGRLLRRKMAGFDVAHLHSVFLWPTYAAARAAERARVPYLLAPRGMLVPDLLARRGRLRKRLWIDLVERRTLARAAGLHATSELEAEEAARLGLQLPPVFVVPNGVDIAPWNGDPEPLASSVRGLIAGKPFLLFLGRVSWKKGLDRLIPALAHVPRALLAIAGNDEESHEPVLRRLAIECGVTDRVTFLGPVGGADKAALLARAAALVLPSYSENFGNSVLEALAAGCPAVVTPEVGLAGVLRESGSGIVAEGAPERLGEALARLLADPVERAEMGRRGIALARSRFSWEVVATAMEKVYQEITDTRQREAR